MNHNWTSAELTDLINRVFVAVDTSVVGPVIVGPGKFNVLAVNTFNTLLGSLTPKGAQPVQHHQVRPKEPWEDVE